MKHTQEYGGNQEAYVKTNCEPNFNHEQLGHVGREAVQGLLRQALDNAELLKAKAEQLDANNKLLLESSLKKTQEQIKSADKHLKFNNYYNDKKK